MSNNKALPATISLYPDQIDAVKNYARYKNYKYEAEAYQEIIDSFFEKDQRQIKSDFIIFFVMPLIFCLLTTIVNLSTGKVFDILLQNGLFFTELFWLSRIFMILSIGSTGVFMACLYWLRKVKLTRYNQGVDYVDKDK